MASRIQTAEKPVVMMTTTSLGGGGAERHLVRIANELQRDYDIHIAVLRAGGTYTDFLHRDIQVHHVGHSWFQHRTLISARFAIGTMSRLIRKLQPGCLLSFLEPANFTTHFGLQRSGISTPHLVAIQNNLTQTLREIDSFLNRGLVRGVTEAIATADGVIAISGGVQANIVELFPQLESRTTVIYNAAVEDNSSATVPADSLARKPHQIVACGRLVEQKGFIDLLSAINLARKELDVGCWLMGVGPLEDDLRRKADELDIDDAVNFLGFQRDPLPVFAAADLFVLSSWWEGFGNVLVEAMSVGTPVVATDCPYGPGEIISHEGNGILVPPREPEALASQIVRVLKDDSLRSELARSGHHRSADFSAKNIASQYARAIDHAIKASSDSGNRRIVS